MVSPETRVSPATRRGAFRSVVNSSILAERIKSSLLPLPAAAGERDNRARTAPKGERAEMAQTRSGFLQVLRRPQKEGTEAGEATAERVGKEAKGGRAGKLFSILRWPTPNPNLLSAMPVVQGELPANPAMVEAEAPKGMAVTEG